MHRFLAILFFFGSGAGSIHLFYQIPSLPFLQGLNEEALRTAVSLAWVMIIPTWMLLFFVAMALLQIILRMIDSKKWVSCSASNFLPCLSFGYQRIPITRYLLFPIGYLSFWQSLLTWYDLNRSQPRRFFRYIPYLLCNHNTAKISSDHKMWGCMESTLFSRDWQGICRFGKSK